MAFRQKYGLADMTQISSVDLRRLCRPVFPAETFGCYIDLMRTAHHIDADFWDVARDVSFKLITTLARDRLSASLMKLPGWDVYRQETVPTMTHKRRLDGLGITTARWSGLVRDYGPLTLTGVTMMVSTVMFGSALFVIRRSAWLGSTSMPASPGCALIPATPPTSWRGLPGPSRPRPPDQATCPAAPLAPSAAA